MCVCEKKENQKLMALAAEMLRQAGGKKLPLMPNIEALTWHIDSART